MMLATQKVSFATKQQAVRPARRAAVTVRAAAVAGEVPSMEKRNTMNLLLLGAIGLPATAMLGPYAYFFAPQR